ncbi:hypothetical protein [Siminovitchia sp. 179-K 8D1 HS]|uniref:hypothetical protein n=1 Tax=Siminovitchia sp. 179-K 8D1 HS TaxID=3142385 RepID=UPI0039A0E06E
MKQEEKEMISPYLTGAPAANVYPKGICTVTVFIGGTALMRLIRPCASLFADSDAWPAE